MDGIRQLSRAWFSADIRRFTVARTDVIVGTLAINNPLPTDPDQRLAWSEQISILQSALAGLAGHVFFEFDIPRIGRRIDVVVLTGGLVFVLEFKVGSHTFERAAVEQVWDYALDLKNFHEPSHSLRLVPILIATKAVRSGHRDIQFADDGVARPLCVTSSDIRTTIDQLVHANPGPAIDVSWWHRGAYRPTPTIIEAARTLYARHSVDEIARNDAGAKNLQITSRRVEMLIDEARSDSKKIICFVTGVPGAGKTLVGLNVATRRGDASPTHAVFLSGNAPLVAVLRAALIRDERRRRAGEQRSAGTREANPVKSFVQNVHHFRDAALVDPDDPPVDHVAIFDEAQRAWDLKKTADFMKRRKGQPNFHWSEPAFLISYMDRHTDWAVIVCLVGGGQEIHTGEAGISEWLEAVRQHFPHWQLYISSQLTDSEYAAGCAIDKVQDVARPQFDDALHLAVSMRSFRAENLSAFVKAMLDRDDHIAQSALETLAGRYPVFVTRELTAAKQWVRSKARGSERYGLLASSKAMRLKPYSIDVRVAPNPVHWFLGDADDVRSSQYLEDVATEFQVQGLELDWTIVNWDGDLRATARSWAYHDFRGTKWQRVRKAEHQNYLRNAYRVLLTRARQGMVLFVPPGDSADHTRPPSYYDSTYRYLRQLGVASID
ncbi:MAG: DUF2075 domain-containing protein [Steroidobacteraceae bacterium]